jgi:glutamate-1-semialdehyde 2,1-aminomutase
MGLKDRSRSRAAYSRACQLMPGGVNSPARAFGAVGGEPLFIRSGRGATIEDLDGNRYLDYVGSWGPLILGHCHPAILAAIQEALACGTTFGAPTEEESELADLITRAMPAVEMVRLVSSGTEASMSAIRLARAFTGRDRVIKFAGCYHGHVDALLVEAGSSATTLGCPSSPGIPQGAARETLVMPYNDVESVSHAFHAEGDRFAAVIVEPVVGNMGVVPPAPGFLDALRALTQKHGTVLIYDEVITGFRLAYGGAQGLFGHTPDLLILGKVVGGGMPLGAFGGRRDIMRHLLPSGKVFQAGTLSGNPLAVNAGIAALRELKKNPPYERLESLGQRLEAGLNQAAKDAGIPHQVARVGSMWTFFFNSCPVTDYDSAGLSRTDLFARFFWKMLEKGIYLPCSQFEASFLSAAHTEEHIDQTIAAARESLEDLA